MRPGMDNLSARLLLCGELRLCRSNIEGAKTTMLRLSRAQVLGKVWLVFAVASFVSACTGGGGPTGDQIGAGPLPEAAPPPSAGDALGTGPVKAALVLPLNAAGNAGAVGQSMRNAAELAMGQFGTDIQVLPRDDAGNASTAQQVSQKAVDDGAEIILGPLFAPSVQAVG